jgi:hypothetical protein
MTSSCVPPWVESVVCYPRASTTARCTRPGRLARWAEGPRAVSRLRAVDDGDNRAEVAAVNVGL